jgi:hypothetical protein
LRRANRGPLLHSCHKLYDNISEAPYPGLL